VVLRNELPAGMTVEPHEPEVPIEGDPQARPVSRRVSLHADLVHLDVRTDDGSHVGKNDDSTVAPGEENTYHWWAPDPVGPVPLTDLADVRHHRHHGLIGALVVEATDAEPLLPRWPWLSNWLARIGSRRLARKLGREAWTGDHARVHGSADEFEEVVVLMQDGLRLFYRRQPRQACPRRAAQCRRGRTRPGGPGQQGDFLPQPEDVRP